MPDSQDPDAEEAAARKTRFRPSLSTLILAGLGLGIASGLFFGEYCASLKVVGRAFVGLLQMSILPYMVVSLIGGIGQLDFRRAGTLALTGGAVLLVSWAIAFVMIFVMPLTFPVRQAGMFFSTSMVEPAQVDFFDLYIPMNPFSSLARTVVPAAAVFSVAVGVALIGIDEEKKRGVLDVLSVTSTALTRVAMMVVKLTPIGVFAISANATGTMTIEEFGKLQAYIVTFVVSALILTFWILPWAVAVLTPFSYRDVLHTSRDALVTGFVTGNLFIVLPLLVENSKALFERYALRNHETDSYVDVLVPVSFNFPNIGKLLTLLFVLFAGWFSGKEISVLEYPTFSILGLFTLFGGVDLALPFLLDQMRIPSDLYQLYVVTGVANSWFATLLAVMNLFAFTLVATCAARGQLTPNWRRALPLLVTTLIVLGGTIGILRVGFSSVISDDKTEQTLIEMTLTEPVPVTVHRTVPDALKTPAPANWGLAGIRERGSLRVGYNSDSVPFAFFNSEGELVGLDVELSHRLAKALEVKLEFVPWEYETLVEQLDARQFDMVAGGLIVSGERLTRMAFSVPYMTVTASLVVEDHRRHDFPNWKTIEETPGLRIGVATSELARNLVARLPRLDVVSLDSYREFFGPNQQKLDGVVISAEAGSAWTILRPEYEVVIPEPRIKRPVALALSTQNTTLAAIVDDWIGMKKIDGTLDQIYDYWIQGKGAEKKVPRWSIIRDVLHWVE